MILDVLKLIVSDYNFFLDLSIEHLQICAIALLIAVVTGLLLGIVISEKQKISNYVLGVVGIIYTIPAISMFGFLIPLTGIGNATAIMALSIYALLPMVRNTFIGITGVDSDILEAAKGMGSTRLQILYKIKLPLAFPVILAGIKNTVVMTIALAGIASFVGAGGLGVAIYRGITTNNAVLTVAGSLLIALLAFISEWLFGFLANSKKRVTFIVVGAILVTLGLASSYETKDNNIIRIATKPMTESFIISEMMKMVIEENTNYTVEITKGIAGGVANIHPAMLKGEFHLYPEYTGTSWNDVLKKKEIPDDETLFKIMNKEYKEKFALEWLGLYGFNNTFGMAVREDIAQMYNLNTISDIARVADRLTFGAEYDFFERADGYDALCEEYDLDFEKEVDIDIGLKYQAIESGAIDAMIIFTTDGQLSSPKIRVLEDDKSFYQTYHAGSIVRSDALQQFKGLSEALMMLDSIINEDEMAKLNYMVEGDKMHEKDVAEQFLRGKNIIKEVQK